MGGQYATLNLSVGGQTLTNMQSDAATQIDVLYNPAKTLNLIWWGGTNDLYFGASAATTITRAQTYYGARQAIGWRQVEVGMLPRTNSGTPSSFETDRQTIRTSRLAQYNIATAETNVWKDSNGNFYVDLGADTTIGLAGQTTNTTYYLDLVHLTNAGYAIVADYVKKAIQLFP
jgi:lysophospholipase L1-like esterase